MADYTYTAVDDLGKRVSGVAVADSEAALDALLRRQGQHLLKVLPSGSVTSLADVRVFERITRRDVIFFTSQLASIVGTGVNLVDGFRDIETRVKKRPMQRVIGAVRQDIETGESLSQALSRHPDVFDELYVNVVRAGEATGRVDRSLDDLVTQLEWREDLRSRPRELTTYPAIVVGLIGVVVVTLVMFTIPRITAVYQQLQATRNVVLPMPTRIVMGTSLFVRDNWLPIVLVFVVLFILLRLQAQSEEGRVRLHRWLLQIPLIGEVARRVALSRFAHYLGTFQQSGLELAPSLSLVERLIGNAFLARQFRRAVDRVMAGDSLSVALASVGEFPPVIIQMIAIGERTGRMEKALEDVRIYYDKDVDRTIKQSLTLFGPIMLIVLAAVFVLMALAYYLPLLRLLNAIPGNPTGGVQ
jgi:type II secretory pathway component PulF